MIETMDSVNVQLIWILFVTDVFRSTGPVVNASDVCGQIEIVRPPIAGRNVTLKFFPIQRNQHGTVEWKRRNGNTSWRNLNGNSRFLQHEENGVYYLIITRASSSTDKANYMAYYKSGDTIACSSDAVSLTLIGLENCGYIYLRSTKIIINETVEIGYYPTLNIFKSPDRYVRHWFHSDDCIKGCTTDQPNSKFEAQLYPNHEYVLKIHHFKTTDEGEYKLQCTTGRENNVFTDPVNIVLPVPPSTPVLTPLETIDGCTNCIVGKDDTELEVLCSSIEGTRPLDVTIKVADTRLKVELDESNGEYRARLRLNDTVLHMTKLVCSVDNQATAVPLTAEAYIYIIKASNTTSLHIPSRLIEGDPVNITCIKRNIRPAASNITMLIDGNMVDGLELRHQLDNVTLLYNSWVTLTKFQRHWNKKDVTCCEYNKEFTTDDNSACSSPKSVDFIFPPNSVTLQIDSSIKQEEQYYVFRVICYINDSNPECDATWEATPQEVIVYGGLEKSIYNSKDGSTTSIHSVFVNVSFAENGNNITCTPSCGTHFDDIPISSGSMLLPFVPDLEFNTSSELLIFKGSITYAKCTSYSHPPSNLTWFDADTSTSIISCNQNDHHVVSSAVAWRPEKNYNGITECTIAIDTRNTSAKTMHMFCIADHIFRSINKSLTINVIEETSQQLPIELMIGIGGAVALVFISTCMFVIIACKYRKSKVDKNHNPVDVEMNEHGQRQESPSRDEGQNEQNLVYANLVFDGNAYSSSRPVMVRRDSPVEYVTIDFVKTVDLAKKANCEDDEDDMYLTVK